MGEMADELREQEMLAQLDEELLYEQTYYILNKGIWPSTEGEISIEKMTDQHLENAIKYMERNPDTIIAEAGGIKFLKAEQKRRLSVKKNHTLISLALCIECRDKVVEVLTSNETIRSALDK